MEGAALVEEGIGLARLPAAPLLVAIAAVAACDKGEPLGAARAYSDSEIAALEQRVMTRIAANRARRCTRPVLHGDSRTDPAPADQLALAEPTGAFAGCVNAMRDYRMKMQPSKGRANALVDSRDPKAVLIDSSCGTSPDTLIAAAVAHVDACSPYQPGVRFAPGVPSALLHVGHVIGLRATVRANAGEISAALQLLADGIRWEQDMMRGHTNLSDFMVAAAEEHVLLRYADPIVENASSHDAEGAIALFDALDASEPLPTDLLQGESETIALHMGLARVKSSGWVPPGGATDFTTPGNGTTADRNAGTEIIEHALKIAEIYANACPERATLASCRQGLVPFGDALGRLEMPLDTWDLYLGVRAAAVSHLAAMRIALEVRRNGHCPTEADLATPRYTALVSPSILGERVRVTRKPDALEVAPPIWADRKKTSWTIHCP